jgi:hypothetical protein
LQDSCSLLDIQLSQTALVISRFYDDFMRTDAAHRLIEAGCLMTQFAFYSQDRKFVRHNPNLPTRSVCRGVVRTQGEYLPRGFALVARAERADRHLRLLTFNKELTGLTSALIFSNDPGPLQRVPSEVRQGSDPYGFCVVTRNKVF